MVTRKIDELGRIVIPRDYRRALGLTPQTPLEMELNGETIVVRKKTRSCVLCGAPATERFEIELCDDCIRKIQKL